MLLIFTPVDFSLREVQVSKQRALHRMTRIRLWIVAAVLVAMAIAQVAEPVDSVFDRLSKVEIFAFGPTGYAGAISQGEKDYKMILSRPSAIADFERFFSAGNPQAKSYALVGIRAIKPNRFKELSSSLRDSKEENVTTQSGCIVSHKSLGTVLKHIDAGDYSARMSSR